MTGADPRAPHARGRAASTASSSTLGYDQLVVALGSVSRTLPIPGLAEHAIGLKSLADATALRNQVLNCMDIAESLEDPALRAEYLGFVFVGAGYAGVEGLAELQDFAAQAIELYPRCRAHGHALGAGRGRGADHAGGPAEPVRVRRTRAARPRDRGADSDDAARGEPARARSSPTARRSRRRTVVWTAGVKPSPVIARLGLPLDRSGRVLVDRDDAGHRPRAGQRAHAGRRAHVWAIGDCAAVPDASRRGAAVPADRPARDPPGTPGGAQHRRDLGRSAASRPFRYRTKGVVAELGRNEAVAITLGIRWRGLPAWLIARTYHLLLMPGVGRRLRLLADWNVALVFGRDPSSPGRLGSPTPLGRLAI